MKVRVRRMLNLNTTRLWRKRSVLSFRLFIFLFLMGSAASTAAQDIVIYASDVASAQGNWSRASSSSGAGGEKMTSADLGWASTNTAQANPSNYFEASVNVQAWTSYRVWVRLRATGDSKWNDSVYVQFSNSVTPAGNAAYRIGTSSGYVFNGETCGGCGLSSWGWSSGAWWLSQGLVQFAAGGSQTLRVQTREDGVEIDQIVLSPSRYIDTSPGRASSDSTIVSKSASTAPSTGGAAPVAGSAAAKPLPGKIEAEDFDAGANGTAYSDDSGGNSGGEYKNTDVDIEGSADGGYNVGWTSGGEWLNYTVNVGSTGTYTVELRVASPSGSSLHVDFNGTDKTGTAIVPSTGGWQEWMTVRKTVSLSAGTQVMRVYFDVGQVNLNYINVVSGGTSTPTPPAASGGGSSSSGPFGGSRWSVPGRIEAENFDNGANGVSYYDTTGGNFGGTYRSTDVDIAATGTGGNTVGWTEAGEWLAYSINVTSGGAHTLTARVASSGRGGTFHVEFNGVNRTGAMSIPDTGGWDIYQDVTANVQLDGGAQTMRIVMDGNGSTGGVGNISYVRIDAGSVSAPTPAPSPTPTPTPTPPSGGGRVRVMTWNINFGHGDPWGQAQVIASSGADVVMLQEASTYDENMPATYPDRLRQLTGQTWYSAWGPSLPGASGSQGTLILSRYPIVSSTPRVFDGTGTVRALIDIGGVRVNFYDVHLEYYDSSRRTSQLVQFMDWMRSIGGARIAGGDFNSWWGEWWINFMETEYSDTWQDVTGGEGDGYTLNGNIRFDYLFRGRDESWRLTPTGVWNPWTGTSDHIPVVADYTVR